MGEGVAGREGCDGAVRGFREEWLQEIRRDRLMERSNETTNEIWSLVNGLRVCLTLFSAPRFGNSGTEKEKSCFVTWDRTGSNCFGILPAWRIPYCVTSSRVAQSVYTPTLHFQSLTESKASYLDNTKPLLTKPPPLQPPPLVPSSPSSQSSPSPSSYTPPPPHPQSPSAHS